VIKRSSAPTILTIGLVLACVSVLAACIHVAALDQGTVASDAGRMLRTGQIESSMRPRAAAALAAVVPAGATLGTGTGAEPNAAVDSMLHDPAFTQAFEGALGSVWNHAFQGENGPIVLDPTLVHSAALSTVAALDPAAGNLPGTDTGPPVAVDSASIPNLGAVASGVRVAGSLAGVLGVILIATGILVSDRRTRAVGRLGRWIAGTGIAVVVLFWLLPELVLPVVGGWTEVAGVVMSSGGMFLVPGLALTAVGVAVAFGANRLIALGREHTLSVVPKAPMRRTTAADRKWRDSA